MKKCKFCKKLHGNMKFCSQGCHNNYDKKHKINRFNPKLQSNFGKKGGKRTHELHPNLASEMGKKNIRKSLETCKRKKKGFWDSELQRENGRKGIETQRKKKIGPFFNPDVHREVVRKAGKIGGKRVHELHPNLASQWGKLTHKLYPNLSSENGRKSAKILREKKGYIFYSIHFDSKSEMATGMCIHYQIEKLVEEKNYQVKVGNLTYDFFIKKFNCFVEYHPFNGLYDTVESYKNWGIKRRKVLNENGYKNYPLIVIK